jgi:hypothetical protein
MKSYESLIEGIIDFVLSKYKINWSPDTAEKLLEEYLQENQIKLLNDLIDKRQEKVSTMLSIEPEPQYLIAKYIEYLQISQSSELDFLETVVKGNMLANSIFLSEPGLYQRRFKNTTIYLDAPLIIFALGYTGEPRKWPVTELILLLKNYGAQLKIFRHSFDEIVGILSACSEIIRRGQFKDSYGPSMEYFIQTGYSETDIMMFIANLESDLLNLGISVVDKPPYEDFEISINEEEFCIYLKDRVSYSKDPPLERDKDSITAVLRLRRGQAYVSYEECQALFVTSNLSLAYCARDYPDYNYQVGTVPLVLTDYELTNLVWLKNPSLSPNLPRRRIIADSYASIQPTDSLWSKYLGTIERFKKDSKISTDQYFVLRHSIQAKSELLEKTRNDERVFTEGTVDEILKSIEDKIKAADIAKLNAEVLAKQKAQQNYENERDARTRFEEKTKCIEYERLLKIKKRASNTAKYITIVIEFLLLILFGYLTYLISPIGPLNLAGNVIPKPLKIFGLVIFWLLLILQTMNTFMDIGPKMLLGHLQDKLAYNIEKYLNPE